MSTEAPAAPVTEQTPPAPEIVIEAPQEKPLWGNIKVGEKPAAEKPAETPEVKKPDEVTPEVKKASEAPKNGKEESLANLRKKLEEKERELEDFRGKYTTVEKEYNEFKSKPFELPEEVKTKLTKAEQERDEYLKEIRAVRIEKDPEFVERYVKPIQSRISVMQKVALEAGVDEAALRAGFGNWSKQTFGEWMEAMDPGQKAKFSAAWGDAEILEEQRLEKLKDANKTWEEMTKAQEQQYKAQQAEHLSQNEKLAKALLKEMIHDNENYKEYEDVPGAAEEMVLKAARYELNPKEVFQQVIASQALARVNIKLNEKLSARDATIAELQKKVEEQETFIKEHASSTPRPDASGVIPKNGEKVPALWDIKIAPR